MIAPSRSDQLNGTNGIQLICLTTSGAHVVEVMISDSVAVVGLVLETWYFHRAEP